MLAEDTGQGSETKDFLFTACSHGLPVPSVCQPGDGWLQGPEEVVPALSWSRFLELQKPYLGLWSEGSPEHHICPEVILAWGEDPVCQPNCCVLFCCQHLELCLHRVGAQ